MALLPTMGRKNPRVFLGISLIYALLILGGITMIYPFMITVTGAVSNDLDYYRLNWYPTYWFDQKERYLKYLAERYLGRFDFFKSAYRIPTSWGGFRDLPVNDESMKKYFPIYGIENNPLEWKNARKITADYDEFLRTDYNSRRCAENTIPLFSRWQAVSYQEFLRGRYLSRGAELKKIQVKNLSKAEQDKIALDKIIDERGDYYGSFEDVSLGMYLNYAYHLPKWMATPNLRHFDFVDWVRTLPGERKMPVTRQYLWFRFLEKKDLNTEKFNALPGIKEAGMTVESIAEVKFPVSEKSPAALLKLRKEFIEEEWPVRLRRIEVTAERQRDFEKALQEQYPSISVLNEIAGANYGNWNEIKLTDTIPSDDDSTHVFQLQFAKLNAQTSAWRNFVGGESKLKFDILCPETAWQDFLKRKYGTIEALNADHGSQATSFESVELPVLLSDYVYYVDNRNYFFREFNLYNFTRVIEFLAIRGNAFWNTLILVVFTIAATLIVNPLAAYALSRFRLRRTNQILIFLLATMAFPPEVAMIPSFLLLRDLHLLNTFGALILPTLANGFSIFLLKGFFDSLPKELYEAAAIDGANEVTLFFNITMALCKPILAVIALNAFIASYSGFMWAFLVCQDSSMWTLMVWLFNYQNRMSEYPYMVMASLVLASIPTLIVFMFCQKIILRGIVVPSMK